MCLVCCVSPLAIRNATASSSPHFKTAEWVGSSSLTPSEVAIRSVSDPNAIVKTSHMPLIILAYRRGCFEEGRENCMCCCHRGGRLEAMLEMALLEVEADARRASADPADQDCTVKTAAVDTASMRMHQAQAAIVKRDTYERTTSKLATRTAAMWPCTLARYTQTKGSPGAHARFLLWQLRTESLSGYRSFWLGPTIISD